MALSEYHKRTLVELKNLCTDSVLRDLECTQIPTFGVRTTNGLRNGGIVRLGDLLHKSKEELLKLKNFGKTQLKEVEATINILGFHLKS